MKIGIIIFSLLIVSCSEQLNNNSSELDADINEPDYFGREIMPPGLNGPNTIKKNKVAYYTFRPKEKTSEHIFSLTMGKKNAEGNYSFSGAYHKEFWNLPRASKIPIRINKTGDYLLWIVLRRKLDGEYLPDVLYTKYFTVTN